MANNRRGWNNALPPEKLEAMRAMVEDGVPYIEIARSLGTTEITLRKHFGPSRYRRGELVGFYNEMRKLRGDGSFAPYGDLRREA